MSPGDPQIPQTRDSGSTTLYWGPVAKRGCTTIEENNDLPTMLQHMQYIGNH